MMKDKLPDVGSEYESETCGIHNAFEFILGNFLESMRLWCRIQTQGKDRARREKERQDLSVMVGANLVRLSQLDGMTWDFYREHALPKLLDQLIQTKDAIAQQYLLDCIIQVFLKVLGQPFAAVSTATASATAWPLLLIISLSLATHFPIPRNKRFSPTTTICTRWRSCWERARRCRLAST